MKEIKSEPFHMVVRSSSDVDAGKLTQDHILEQLSHLANSLSFRPEIQVSGRRMVCYPGSRNATIDNPQMLADLFEFTKGIISIIV